mmetsp:Transcript_71515/g.190975  ORF Transcript_71515/g.190975 Transcript_71515/m.190975 type:complete len:83 (-) Transcript_71515:95-343(-)
MEGEVIDSAGLHASPQPTQVSNSEGASISASDRGSAEQQDGVGQAQVELCNVYDSNLLRKCECVLQDFNSQVSKLELTQKNL